MSWIGGLNNSFNQISSLTGQIGGQISNFTKEVLAEGTDDNIDPEAEIRRLRVKLIETEALVGEKEAEISKHVQANSSLHEKVRAAQVDASTLAHEYQTKFQEQQKLIDRLKNGESHSEDGFQILNEDDFRPGIASRRTLSGGSVDAAEFDDIITAQREINRLSLELAQVKEERSQWNSSTSSNTASASDADSGMLQAKIKDLQDELHRRISQHQHELLALQEANAATVRRYQSEIRSLRTDSSHDSSADQSRDALQKVTSLSAEVEELNERLRTKSRQVQAQKSKMEEMTKDSDEQKRRLGEMEASLSLANAEKLKLEQLSRELESSSNEKHATFSKALTDLRLALGVPTPDADDLDLIDELKLLRDSGARLREEIDQLKDEKQSGEWDAERLQSNPSSATLPQHLMQPLYQSSPRGKTDEKFLFIAEHDNDDCEVSAVGGDLTLTLQALQKQVEEYEAEIAQYEMVKKDWQNEKTSLQLMLDRYQAQLVRTEPSDESLPATEAKVKPDSDVGERESAVADLKRELAELKEARENLEKDKHKLLQEKEQLQLAALNLEEELNMSIADAQGEKDQAEGLRQGLEQALAEKKRLEAALKSASDELDSSRMEKADLDQALEALDSQHQDEMSQLLMIRDELSRKLKASQDELRRSTERNTEVEASIQELKKQIEQSGNVVDEADRRAHDEERLKEANQRNASLVEQLRDENERLMQRVTDVEENMLNAETEVDETRDKLSGVAGELEAAVVKLDQAKALKNQALARVSCLEQERDELSAKLAAAEDGGKTALASFEQDRMRMTAQLDGQEKEHAASLERLSELERDNEELMLLLRSQAKEHLEDLQKSESKLDAVELKRKTMEDEQMATIAKMNELKKEHERVMKEMEDFHKKSQGSEEEFSSVLQSKEADIERLKSEIDVLKADERKRIDALVKLHENDEEEGTMLKNEIERLEKKLSSAAQDTEDLRTELEDAKKKLGRAEKDAAAKAVSVNELAVQMEGLRNSSDQNLKMSQDRERRMMEMRVDNEKAIAELKDKYEKQLDSLKSEHDAQMGDINSRHEEDLTLLQQQCLVLEEAKSSLERQIGQLSDDANSVAVLQNKNESLRESLGSAQVTIDGFEKKVRGLQEKIRDLEVANDDLKSTVDSAEDAFQKKSIVVEDLDAQLKRAEEELKSKVELLQTLTDDNNRLSRVKTELEERVQTIEFTRVDDEKLRVGSLQRSEAELKKLTESNSSLAAQLDQQRTLVNSLREELESRRAESAKLERQLAALTSDGDRRSKELESTLVDEKRELEAKWRSRVSDLEGANRATMDKLKEEHARRLAQAVADVKASHEFELGDARDRVVSLTAAVESLKEELVAGKARRDDDSKSSRALQARLTKALGDVDALTSQLNDANALRQKEVKELLEEVDRLKQIASPQQGQQDPDNQIKEYESKIAELTSEVTKLRLAGSKASFAADGTVDIESMLQEIRSRDLSGLEKSDLSKDDIGTLLELIKERDRVIDALQEKHQNLVHKTEVQGASSSSKALEEKVRELTGEREQILAVISEKTKENRQLKDENRRMVDVTAANENALSKAQEELRQLHEKYGGYDHEMTKETVARLSKIISEKDFEIESLKQKCQTLLDVLQQQEKTAAVGAEACDQLTVTSQQVQALLRDRETLAQQVRQLLTERDHLVALVNSKHQEALVFQQEAQKASEALERDAAENSNLQIRFGNLVHDYDQLEMKLASTRRELAGFKEALNHLEESKEILLSKVELSRDELKPETPPTRVEAAESPQAGSTHQGKSRDELEAILDKKSQSLLHKDLLLQEKLAIAQKLEEQIRQLQNDQREKDILIHQKMDESARLAKELSQKSNEASILRKSVENLREQVAGCTQDNELLRGKVATLEESMGAKSSECDAYQETNAQLSMMLKEREYEMEAMKEKVSSMTEILQQSEQGKDTEAQKYLAELDRAKEQATSAKHERDQIMLTLKQKQLETQRANEDAQQLRDKEMKLQSELSRLRGHLVQVEEAYTQEAVLASDREQSLRERLEQLQNRSASVKEASEQSKQQVESLQEQLRSMTSQRDQAVQQFQLAQEQSHRYAAALQQLQAAAERMQREEAATYAAQVEKINRHYEAKAKEAAALAQKAQELKERLDDASEALESASRLNEQLELKEQSIDQLKEIVSEKQLIIEETQDQLHAAKARNEGMVDRELMKNLLTGYFHSPSNKQSDVLRLIANVIGFTDDEMRKLEQPKKGWIGGWLSWSGGASSQSPNGGGGASGKSDDLNESFSQMFVKFLEHESLANKPTARLPAASMAHEAQLKMSQRKLASEGIPTPAFNPPRGGDSKPHERSTVAGLYNPFLAPAASSSNTSAAATSKPSSHPLMQPLTPILPTFAPVAEVKPTDERDLLQGILHSDAS